MNPIGLLMRELRRDTAMARTARKAIKQMLSLRVPPTPLHKALLAEHQLRGLLVSELTRSLYWQPLFELLCAQVGDGCRLILCPDSKLPAIDNCRLVLGNRVSVSARTTFVGARNGDTPEIRFGDGTWVGDRNIFRAGLGIEVGSNVLFGGNVTVAGDPGHPMDAMARRSEPAPREDLGRITIGDDVWLAEGCTILGNVTIGEGAVVAARSVVTKDVPARTVVAGIPAKVVREIPPSVKKVA